MDIEISTSDPDHVDPAEIAKALGRAGYLVISVSVNEGERTWEMGDQDEEPVLKYQHTHVSVNDGSPAMLVGQNDTTVMLVNEDGYEWADPKDQWRPIGIPVHIVAIAYDGTVSAIVRQDVESLIDDLVDNHGDPEVTYSHDIETVVEQIERETGYTLSYQVQEI